MGLREWPVSNLSDRLYDTEHCVSRFFDGHSTGQRIKFSRVLTPLLTVCSGSYRSWWLKRKEIYRRAAVIPKKKTDDVRVTSHAAFRHDVFGNETIVLSIAERNSPKNADLHIMTFTTCVIVQGESEKKLPLQLLFIFQQCVQTFEWKFAQLLKNKIYALTSISVEICLKMTNLYKFNYESPHFVV